MASVISDNSLRCNAQGTVRTQTTFFFKISTPQCHDLRKASGNKLAILEATPVGNSAHLPTYLLTRVKSRATSVAKNSAQVKHTVTVSENVDTGGFSGWKSQCRVQQLGQWRQVPIQRVEQVDTIIHVLCVYCFRLV